MKKSNYLQLTAIVPLPNTPTPQKPYNKYAFTGGQFEATNQGVQFFIPPSAYRGLETNELDVELILGHSFKGIGGNVGFYTVEFDFGFMNSKNTTNSKYQTMYMKLVNATDTERYSQETRQNLRISGRPDVIRTKYQINGNENYSNTLNQLYLFKFTEV